MASDIRRTGTNAARQGAGKAGAQARRGKGRGRWKRLFALTFLLLLTVVAVASVWGFFLVRSIAANLPGVDKIADIRSGQPTTVVSSDGTVLATLQTQYRRPVGLSAISPALIDATIATEDSRFYEHNGVDGRGIARALLGNLKAGDPNAQGASTITQQLARNLFLTTQKTYRRKIEELLLARKIEESYSKSQILEAYLNTIYYGSGAYGIEAASRTYFGKSAKDLTLGEAALLAGVPQRPTAFAPNVHRDAALKRRSEVLSRMVATGKITEQQRTQAEAAKLRIRRKTLSSGNAWKAPYFVSEVLEQLKAQYGEEFVYSGVRIETTLNWKIQQAAERALQNALTSGRRGPNTGCLVSLDPHNGYVRALVGGPDFHKDQFDAAVKGTRQPGSSFKPILYATAFDRSICDLNTQYRDEKLEYDNHPGIWRVHNYESGYRGQTTVLDAVRHSINTIAVKVNEATGPENVVEVAKSLGIATPLQPDLPLALGASAVHPIEICSAYSSFANNGERYDPTFIVRIVAGRDQEVLRDDSAIRHHDRVLKPTTIDEINVALREVVTSGTGRAAAAIPDARGKTGTTSNHLDAWFVGYTSDLTTAVWVARIGSRTRQLADDGKPMVLAKYAPMAGGTGGVLCAPIWRNFMEAASPVQQAVNSAHGVAVGPLKAPDTATMLTQLRDDARKAALAKAQAERDAAGDSPNPSTENPPITPDGSTPGVAQNGSAPVPVPAGTEDRKTEDGKPGTEAAPDPQDATGAQEQRPQDDSSGGGDTSGMDAGENQGGEQSPRDIDTGSERRGKRRYHRSPELGGDEHRSPELGGDP